MDESTPSTEELFLVLYCTIDELYQEVAPDRVRTRPGSDRLEMSDSEIITLDGPIRSCKKDVPTVQS